jgi:all-trans-retinol 13,14-reductase
MLRHSNIFAFPSIKTSFYPREGIIEGSPLFITGTRTEGTQEGAEGFMAICPVPHVKNAFWSQSPAHDYDRFKEEMAHRLRAYIEAVIPELKRNITFAECATPFTLMKWMNTPTGSLYGVKHKRGQMNPMSLTKIKNLYLAGQAVINPGIMGAMISAFLACGYIVGHETLRKELRECI